MVGADIDCSVVGAWGRSSRRAASASKRTNDGRSSRSDLSANDDLSNVFQDGCGEVFEAELTFDQAVNKVVEPTLLSLIHCLGRTRPFVQHLLEARLAVFHVLCGEGGFIIIHLPGDGFLLLTTVAIKLQQLIDASDFCLVSKVLCGLSFKDAGLQRVCLFAQSQGELCGLTEQERIFSVLSHLCLRLSGVLDLCVGLVDPAVE